MKDRFIAPTGLINVDPYKINTPYDAFRLFFDDDVYKLIVEKTNLRVD